VEKRQRQPVSAFVICRNEEEHIAPCLESLSFCDDVLVIDSHSTDRTRDIAQDLGARVIERDWPGYRAQKAFGLSQTQHEWVINLDADERISPELKTEILKVLENTKDDDPVVGYYMNRLVYYLGRWWEKGGWYPEYRLRFFRKSRVTWGGKDPHEKPIAKGRTAKLEGDIHHYTYRDFHDQIERLHHFSSIAAKQDFERGRKFRLSDILLRPLVRSFKFFILKRGYREGVAGLIVAISEGYYTFLKYAKLWDKEFSADDRE